MTRCGKRTLVPTEPEAQSNIGSPSKQVDGSGTADELSAEPEAVPGRLAPRFLCQMT